MSPIRPTALECIVACCFVSTVARADPNAADQVPPPPVSSAQAPNDARPEPRPSEPRPEAKQPAATPGPAPATRSVPFVPARFKKPTLGWDLNLEGGYGRYFADPAERFGFARARAGLLYSVDPMFYSVGITYDWSNLAAATFGLQAEVMHIESGLWAQAGGLLDTQVHPGVMGSVGWSIFGAEIQYRKFDPNDWGPVVVGKLRIPVTFIAKAFE
jgi:hypothetical protein